MGKKKGRKERGRDEGVETEKEGRYAGKWERKRRGKGWKGGREKKRGRGQREGMEMRMKGRKDEGKEGTRGRERRE